MRGLRPVVFALGALLFSATCLAVDLNAPLEDHPTLASEITRGWHAAMDCGADNLEALADSLCVSQASSAAEQQHANYKPFELGLFFGEWFHEELIGQSNRAMTDNPGAQENWPKHREHARRSYLVYRQLQTDLGVTDDQLKEIAGKGMSPIGKQKLAGFLAAWTTGAPP